MLGEAAMRDETIYWCVSEGVGEASVDAWETRLQGWKVSDMLKGAAPKLRFLPPCSRVRGTGPREGC